AAEPELETVCVTRRRDREGSLSPASGGAVRTPRPAYPTDALASTHVGFKRLKRTMKATNRKSKRNGSARDTQAALRALRRAVRKVHAENRRLGMPVIIWKKGETVAVPAS